MVFGLQEKINFILNLLSKISSPLQIKKPKDQTKFLEKCPTKSNQDHLFNADHIIKNLKLHIQQLML
jgi:hypothetical protein